MRLRTKSSLMQCELTPWTYVKRWLLLTNAENLLSMKSPHYFLSGLLLLRNYFALNVKAVTYHLCLTAAAISLNSLTSTFNLFALKSLETTTSPLKAYVIFCERATGLKSLSPPSAALWLASTYHAKKTLVASERNNYKRGWFRRRVSGIDPNRLIFIDEAAVNTAMTRRFGRAAPGERVVESVPRNYGEQTSMISAIGLRGLIATMTLEGAVDTLAFNAYINEVLGPKLDKGDVVVLDNLNVHKASQIEEVANGKGARVIWLAPYSPDYSPIEQCWSKIKQALRAAKARTREELEAALVSAMKLVTSSDIRGWFSYCGYPVASD
jgi:transposase